MAQIVKIVKDYLPKSQNGQNGQNGSLEIDKIAKNVASKKAKMA